MASPLILIETRRFSDQRGWFCETFVEDRWAEQGVCADFVQDNQSYSSAAGTVRGIHFQRPPFAQAKLVRCIRGRVFDVAVDLRAGSPTYGRYSSVELSAENGLQLFIPVGFGHGFMTLEPDTEVIYKVSARYAPDCEGGLRWDCPDLSIAWPLPHAQAVLSPKDQVLPGLAEFTSPFEYRGDPIDPDGAPLPRGGN